MTLPRSSAETLDLARPTAVLLLAVLHFIADTDDPAAIVATLARQLAPGSFVAISHLTSDFAPGPVLAGVEAYNTLVPITRVPRTHSQVSALFGGFRWFHRGWSRLASGGLSPPGGPPCPPTCTQESPTQRQADEG